MAATNNVNALDLVPQNTFDGLEEPVVQSERGKKRKKRPEESKREIQKRQRHSGAGKKLDLSVFA